jgi:hypothetical protein
MQVRKPSIAYPLLHGLSMGVQMYALNADIDTIREGGIDSIKVLGHDRYYYYYYYYYYY